MVSNQNVPIKVVLGPRKCGTTTLHTLLSQVPRLAVPSPLKEAHLFDRSPMLQGDLKGFCGETWTDETQGFVDVATHYFSRETLWANIEESEGFIEAVVIVRDPVARAVSHCMHQMRVNNLWHLEFAEIVERHPEIITDSLYSVAVPCLRTFFGETRLRLLSFEHLAADPHAVVSNLCSDFRLGDYEPSFVLEDKKMNRGLRPRFPWAYRLLREGARKSRSFLGDMAVERIKNCVMPFWPTSEHSGVKARIVNEMREDPKAKTLVLEREYIAGLIETTP